MLEINKAAKRQNKRYEKQDPDVFQGISSAKFFDLTEEWDTCIQEISPSKEFDNDENKRKTENLFEESRFDDFDEYQKQKVVNDSIVEQMTVPDDSTDFHLKRNKKFQMVNSGLAATGTTNKEASQIKPRVTDPILEDDDDLCFSNRPKDK